jgi:hypothetical protein
MDWDESICEWIAKLPQSSLAYLTIQAPHLDIEITEHASSGCPRCAERILEAQRAWTESHPTEGSAEETERMRAMLLALLDEKP